MDAVIYKVKTLLVIVVYLQQSDKKVFEFMFVIN